MAIKEMEKICNIIREKWKDVKHIAIYHRKGNVFCIGLRLKKNSISQNLLTEILIKRRSFY
jgi:hypothetical protein